MPKGRPKAGMLWPSSRGLARAQRAAQDLVGSTAVIREMRIGNVKHCEIGHSDMTAPTSPWPRPLIVLGAGPTWFAAIAAAERAVADPAVRAEIERHDELLAALVAERRSRVIADVPGPPAEDA